jgi:DNA-binding NarL/FixJ family response regulator
LPAGIPSLSGFEVIARLHREGCRTRFVILTSYAEDAYIREAVALGVDSYILKENSSTELLAALDAVSEGLKYMAPKVLASTDAMEASQRLRRAHSG